MASLIKKNNHLNKSDCLNTSSTLGVEQVAQSKEVRHQNHLPMDDVLDVLECDDFHKVISDCAEDSINLFIDTLSHIFQKRTINPSTSKLQENTCSVEVKPIRKSFDKNNIHRRVSSGDASVDGK